MKKIYLLSALAILLTCCNSQNNQKTTAPRIMFNKDTIDLGNVSQKDTAQGGVAFVNGGEAPLKIIEVTASCGCTTPRYDSLRTYQKGEVGVIDISLVPTKDTGMMIKNIVVQTNSEKKLKVLYIKCRILE
jgi:Protein of unknown function (DUF1573)